MDKIFQNSNMKKAVNLIVTDLDSIGDQRVKNSFKSAYERKTQEDLRQSQLNRSKDLERINPDNRKMQRLDSNFEQFKKAKKDKKESLKKVIRDVQNYEDKKRGLSPQSECFVGPGGVIQSKDVTDEELFQEVMNVMKFEEMSLKKRNVGKRNIINKCRSQQPHINQIKDKIYKDKIESYANRAGKTQKKLNQYDFDYIFYPDKTNLVGGIVANMINRQCQDENKWLFNEVERLGKSFVLSKLDKEFKVNSSTEVHKNTNKIKWSELFLKQPQVQKLLLNFLDGLEQNLNDELLHNKQQLQNYLNFPRFNPGRIKSETSYQQRNRSLNERQKRIKDKLWYSKHSKEELEETGATPRSADYYMEQTSENKNTLGNTIQTAQKESTRTRSSEKIQKQKANDFLQCLPEVLQKKNKELIEKLTFIMKTDNESRKRYQEVVNDKTLMVNEKIEALQKVDEEYEIKKRHREDKKKIHSMLNDVEYQLDLIKMEGLEFDCKISVAQEESEVEKIFSKKLPAQKLMKRLEEWMKSLKEMTMNKTDMELFRQKLWKITEDFEEQLVNDVKGWELEKSMINHITQERERKLKQHFLFRIEALESALIEAKIDANRKVDRAEMEMEDLRSQQMSMDFHGHYKSIEGFQQNEEQYLKSIGIRDVGEFSKTYKTSSATVIVDHSQLQLINKRINDYFEFMRMQQKEIQDLQNDRAFQIHKQKEIELEKDEIHKKSVKYQDLVHGILQILFNMFSATKMLDEQEIMKVRLQTTLEDLKMTFEIDQIENVIKIMEHQGIEKKIKEYKDGWDQKVTSIKNLHQKIHELRASNWLSQIQSNVRQKQEAQPLKRASTMKKQKEHVDEETMVYENMKQIFQLSTDLILFFDVQDELIIDDNQTDKQKLERKFSVLQGKSGEEPARRSNTMVNKNPPIGMRDLNKLEKITGQRRTDVNRGFGGQKNSNMDIGRRMTFFGETSETIIQSQSKKKIFYMYDQLSRKPITKELSKKFDYFVKKNTFSRILLVGDKSESNDLSVMSPVSSNNSFASDDDPELLGNDVDSIIQNINKELSFIFKRNMMERFPDFINERDVSENKLIQNNLYPVDLIKLEAYQLPQINVVPIKLLLLKGLEGKAANLVEESLKYILNLFPHSTNSNSLKFISMFKKAKQTQFPTETGYTTAYMDAQRIMESFFAERINQFQRQQKLEQQNLKLEFGEQAFDPLIDKVPASIELIQHIRHSLRICKDEKEFFSDLEVRFNDFHKECEVKARDAQKKEISDQFESKGLDYEQLIEKGTGALRQLIKLEGSKSDDSDNADSISFNQEVQKQKSLQQLQQQKSGRPLSQKQLLTQQSQKPSDQAQSQFLEGQNIEMSTLELEERKRTKQLPFEAEMQTGQFKLARQEELFRRGYKHVDMNQKEVNKQRQQIIVKSAERLNILKMVQQSKTSIVDFHITEQQSSYATPVEKVEIGVQVDIMKKSRALTTPAISDKKIIPLNSPSSSSKTIQLKTFDTGVSTDICMEDLQLILEFKQRSVQKIKNLEDIIRNQKEELRFLKLRQSSSHNTQNLLTNDQGNTFYQINFLVNPKDAPNPIAFTEVVKSDSDNMSPTSQMNKFELERTMSEVKNFKMQSQNRKFLKSAIHKNIHKHKSLGPVKQSELKIEENSRNVEIDMDNLSNDFTVGFHKPSTSKSGIFGQLRKESRWRNSKFENYISQNLPKRKVDMSSNTKISSNVVDGYTPEPRPKSSYTTQVGRGKEFLTSSNAFKYGIHKYGKSFNKNQTQTQKSTKDISFHNRRPITGMASIANISENLPKY